MGRPSYLDLLESGELKARAEQLIRGLEACNLCPHHCGVDRLEGELGKCRTGRFAKVSSYGPHFGEEPPLVGRSGSGTIFFANCNLACIFCQNHDISQLGHGFEVKPARLAQMMIDLQTLGCHNVNFVSPTHVVPQIIESLAIASSQGLKLPLVYNSGGYDEIPTLELLEGVVDIYMPDAKYGDDATGLECSGIEAYWTTNQAALREMHRQAGDLVIEREIAARGLLIRHLVLPNNLAGSEKVLQFIGRELSKDTYLNVMDQYRPCYQADRHPKLARRISLGEYTAAVRIARSFGLHRFA